MRKPFLSVVIPTCQRIDLLQECLFTLAPGNQTYNHQNYEVIVSDDGMDTTTKKAMTEKFPWAQWVQGPQKGPASNRNNGAKYAKGQWLVFTDDDCLSDSRWLAAYAKAIADYPDYLVFEGRTYADRKKRRLDEEAPINEIGGYLWSCNFAIHKRLFENLDGFDERFPYAAMEDVDLHFRLKKQDYTPLFVKEAAICHPWRRISNWRIYERRFQSTLIFLDKNKEMQHEINYKTYLKAILRNICFNFIGNFPKHRFRGWKTALLHYYVDFKSTLILYKIYKYKKWLS